MPKAVNSAGENVLGAQSLLLLCLCNPGGDGVCNLGGFVRRNIYTVKRWEVDLSDPDTGQNRNSREYGESGVPRGRLDPSMLRNNRGSSQAQLSDWLAPLIPKYLFIYTRL